MALRNTKIDSKFVTILADGSMRVAAPEGHPDAVRRDYETSDGKTGTKYEFVYSELEGVITKVDFYDGDFGKQLLLTITDGDEDPVTLAVSTASNYGEDLMKKLPAIKMDEPVILVPYSFEDEKGKKRKGVTVYQGGKEAENKIENFYYDKDKKKNLYGFPTPEIKKGQKWDSDKWKLYFLTARTFLVDDITARFVKEEEVTEDEDSDVEEIADSAFGKFPKK